MSSFCLSSLTRSGVSASGRAEEDVYKRQTWNEKETRTELVRIGYADGKFTDGSTGSVAGELNDNFSLDEYADHLRVVTTVESWSSDYSDFSRSNSLYVLDSSMKTVGKIENLAEGEEIKSARFMGETGYFGGITIATLGNFSASTGKPKSKKTFNVSAIVASALSGKELSLIHICKSH